MSKTVTRLFDTYADATTAVSELEANGISHYNISIIANNAHGEHAGHDGVNDHGDVTRGTSTGAVLGGAGGLLAGLGLLAIPGLGPIVAAGWLAATAAGAGIGALGGAATGGIVGALKNAGHTDEEANVYSEGVRRGGTLVTAYAGLNVDGEGNPKPLRLHDLRHSFASFGVESNLGLSIVGKLLGHASTQTTARYGRQAVSVTRPRRSVAALCGSATLAKRGRSSRVL